MSNYTGGVHNRRTRALARLQEQLKSNQKVLQPKQLRNLEPEVYMDIIAKDCIVPLEESDVKRIKKEIDVLKSKI